MTTATAACFRRINLIEDAMEKMEKLKNFVVIENISKILSSK